MQACPKKHADIYYLVSKILEIKVSKCTAASNKTKLQKILFEIEFDFTKSSEAWTPQDL